jgi:hypothetical protein
VVLKSPKDSGPWILGSLTRMVPERTLRRKTYFCQYFERPQGPDQGLAYLFLPDSKQAR